MDRPAKDTRLAISAEAVVDVVDSDALRHAALEQIETAEYSSDDERQADIQRVRMDDSGALGQAFDLDSGLEGVPGVELLEASWFVGPADRSNDVPDFMALFPVCTCGSDQCEKCSGFQLTPRTAAVLWTTSTMLADLTYDDVETLGDDPVADDSAVMVLDRYPNITYQQNGVWRRQAARAFDDLTSDIARGGWPVPTCCGEEMALHLVVRDAEVSHEDGLSEVEDLIESLPAHEDDFDWDMCSEVFFQDHDVLTLFNRSLDGIEDPESDINRWLAAGDMRPAAWFTPFDNVEPRDGRRPFRR